MKKLFVTCLALVAILIGGSALAQELIVYPSEGQRQEQVEKDKFSCYTWAKQRTGFDPMETPKATTAPPAREPQKGGLLRGATRGAAVGAIGGAIGGDAGKGAAIGAGVGGLIGGIRRKDQVARQQQEEEQWAREQAAIYTQKRNAYNRAYSACLEAKGYTVK